MNFLSCDQWGALPARVEFMVHNAEGIVIHNTEEEELETPGATARSIQLAHFDRGFSDSGQHFTITKNGTVLEGRHGSAIAAFGGLVVRGAHAGSDYHNSHYFGIELCGDNQLEYVVTPEQWDALVILCKVLCMCRGKTLPIIGHMEVHKTTCPGLIMNHLQELRDEVAKW